MPTPTLDDSRRLGARSVVPFALAPVLVMSRSTSMTGMRVGLVLLGTAAGLYLPSGIATITTEVSQEHWGKALAIHELAPNLGFITATGTLTLLLGLVHGRVTTPLVIFLQTAAAACFFPAGFSMVSSIFPPALRNLAVSMVTVIGSLLGAGAIPPAIGYLAEASSFSLGLCLLGLLSLAMLPLLRYGTASRSVDDRPDRTQEL